MPVKSSPRIMAVIHHRDDVTSQGNAAIAAAAGCDGVLLIQMEGRDEMIDGPSVAIKAMFPELIVGTNRLSTDPIQAIVRDVELGLDATWCDNPGVRSDAVSQQAREIADRVSSIKSLRPNYLYFGSVAFKYQKIDKNPAAAAVAASELGMIATTSGIATGSAPEIAKLAEMKRALGARPLGVASGVTPSNIDEIGPHVDWMLVSTGISRSFHNFDGELVQDLVARARKIEKAAP